MATSSIPAAKAALFARLLADATLVALGVQVLYSEVDSTAPTDDVVFIGNSVSDGGAGPAFGAGQTSAAIGQRRREERYGLEVVCRVRRHQIESQQSVTERAFVVAGAVETSIRDWTQTTPTAFDAAVDGAFVTQLLHEEGEVLTDPSRRGADVRIVVSCRKRI